MKPWTEVVRDKEDDGWDLGHGYEPSPEIPEVSVEVAGSPIREDSTDVATFTLACDEDVDVYFTVDGTAVEGVNYNIDKTSPQPSGSVITITPIHDPSPGDNMVIRLTITPNENYTIGNQTGSIELINVEGPVNPPTEIHVTLSGSISVSHSGGIIVT